MKLNRDGHLQKKTTEHVRYQQQAVLCYARAMLFAACARRNYLVHLAFATHAKKSPYVEIGEGDVCTFGIRCFTRHDRIQ